VLEKKKPLKMPCGLRGALEMSELHCLGRVGFAVFRGAGRRRVPPDAVKQSNSTNGCILVFD